MKIILILSTCLCFSFSGTAIAKMSCDLPESVQRLIDQNSMVARKIVESPYLIERRLTTLHRANEARTSHDISIYAPEQLWTKQSIVDHARDDSGSVDFNSIIRSEDSSSHIDLRTMIRRGWIIRQPDGLASKDECTDPCTCKYMGSIKLHDRDFTHPRLREFAVLFLSKTATKSLTLEEYLEEADDIQYIGREQIDDHWCAVISFELSGRHKLWLDETRNGMVLRIEAERDGRPYGRADFTRGYEVFPGQFIPGERRNLKLSYDEPSESESTVLQYEGELIRLAFDPIDWPNASENDFGFRFMPNSLVHNLMLPSKPLYVIGNSIDDIVFTFYGTSDFERWCDERTGKGQPTSAPLQNEVSSSAAGVSTYSLVSNGLVIIGLVVAAILCFRSLWGKVGR